MEPGLHRARRPAETPLYALLESLFECVKGAWEDLFESRYGSWRRIIDGVVTRTPDCGIFDRGFARLRFTPGSPSVELLPGDGQPPLVFEARDFVARVLPRVPEPRRHLAHDFGTTSNVFRGEQKAT